jgi:hypothetical protein
MNWKIVGNFEDVTPHFQITLRFSYRFAQTIIIIIIIIIIIARPSGRAV